jgi:hypothetical protein
LAGSAPATLELVKSASPTQLTGADEHVEYTFAVTNSGAVPLESVTVRETAFSGSPSPAIDSPPGTLEPGETLTCTAHYTADQPDADRGAIDNTAEATGTAPDGTTTTSAPSSARVPIAQVLRLTLDKTAEPSTVSAAGQHVVYRFTITNTGNVTVTDVRPQEIHFGGTGTLSDISCPPGADRLAPEKAVTCTADYTLTSEDIDHGGFENTARATGTAADTTLYSPPATARITVEVPHDALKLVKSVEAPRVFEPGDHVTYRYEVTNTAHVMATALAVHDDHVTDITCQDTTLAPTGQPGDETTCTGTYLVTEADALAGQVTNTAHATGTAAGTAVTSPDAHAEIRVQASTPTTPPTPCATESEGKPTTPPCPPTPTRPTRPHPTPVYDTTAGQDRHRPGHSTGRRNRAGPARLVHPDQHLAAALPPHRTQALTNPRHRKPPEIWPGTRTTGSRARPVSRPDEASASHDTAEPEPPPSPPAA